MQSGEMTCILQVIVKGKQWFQSTRSGGSATWKSISNPTLDLFQSTRSGGSATILLRLANPIQNVSIHALRGERDGCL